MRCELQPACQAAPEEVQQISGWIQHRIKTLVGISTRVSVLPQDSIERTLVGKARRVIDQRPR